MNSYEGHLKLRRVLMHLPLPHDVGKHFCDLETSLSALRVEDDALLALIADEVEASRRTLPTLDELRCLVRAAERLAAELDQFIASRSTPRFRRRR